MSTTRSVSAFIFASVLAASGCTSDVTSDDTEASGDAMSSLTCQPLSQTWMSPLETKRRLPVDNGAAYLRVGEARPSGTPVGDILFFHGFSDRMDNHRPLFEEWTQKGFRVVSFEYPSHGDSCGRGLGWYGYKDLATFAVEVERTMREESPAERPLFLAGWSMGGLLATRMLQGLGPQLSRPVAGAVLLTPGVDVQFVVKVTPETLTHDPAPPHTGPISPKVPAAIPTFSTNLLFHASQSREEAFPSTVPALVVTGDARGDIYADTPGVEAWVAKQRSRGARLEGLGCDGALHEIDNEVEPIGSEVRRASARFFDSIVRGIPYESSPKRPCRTY